MKINEEKSQKGSFLKNNEIQIKKMNLHQTVKSFKALKNVYP